MDDFWLRWFPENLYDRKNWSLWLNRVGCSDVTLSQLFHSSQMFWAMQSMCHFISDFKFNEDPRKLWHHLRSPAASQSTRYPPNPILPCVWKMRSSFVWCGGEKRELSGNKAEDDKFTCALSSRAHLSPHLRPPFPPQRHRLSIQRVLGGFDLIKRKHGRCAKSD